MTLSQPLPEVSRWALALRGATAIGAYLLTAAAAIGSIALLDRAAGPALLNSFLGYVLIATISAGIEPGTGKAVALAAPTQSRFSIGRSFAANSLLKAAVASPLFLLLWIIVAGGPEQPGFALLLTPPIVMLGFIATDARVLIDRNGNHAAAIWLKQGSLALAVLVTAIVMAAGGTLVAGIALACLARLFWTLAIIAPFAGRGVSANVPAASPVWRNLMLASAIGSLSGSIDRMAALRLLPVTEANAYVLHYEILSKFWLLPYLLTPILFVKLIGPDATRPRRLAWGLTAAAGLPFLLLAPLLALLPAPLLQRALIPPSGLFLFALAILIAAFNQLIAVDLQASGNARHATIATTGGLIAALIAFPLGAWQAGALGLAWAWLLKSLIELGLFGHFFRRARHAS